MKFCLFVFFWSGLELLVKAESEESENATWPSGTYGLPEPVSGCPQEDFWETGSLYQNTEDEMNSNKHSVSFHSKGRFNEHGIEMGFCIKKANSTTRPWPPGKYCLYKYHQCPEGLSEGKIFWQNEKSTLEIPNQHSGTLPDGSFNLTTTLIEFCCRHDGNTSNPIELPTDTPFYLFPFVEECQQFRGMDVSDLLTLDDGNTDYTSGTVPYGANPQEDFNIVLKLCYYFEKEDKVLKMDQNTIAKAKVGIKQTTLLGISAGVGALVILAAIAALIKFKLFL